MRNLFEQVYKCIQCSDPNEKVNCAKQLYRAYQANELRLVRATPFHDYQSPGRPEKPRLVAPRDLPRRSIHTLQGRAALLHSIAHIEFNAINLALDAVYRFDGMPEQYYRDWLQVAAEEAYHFELMANHLLSLGFSYGDFAAHNGLWDMAMQTKHSTLVRMAVIPRGMEARGLDVTPGIMQKLNGAGDGRAIEILEIILRDEIGHVEIGTRWFNFCCDQLDLPRQQTFEKLIQQFAKGRVKLPLHRSARKQAGFTEAELDYLEGLV